MSVWLDTQLEKLNTYQRDAVLTDKKHVIVNAHVGSGKTTVLVTRLVYLHEVRKIPYEDMVVLTFTNKAAGEIKDRLRQADESVSEEAFAYMGTFHGVALKLLKTKLATALEASCTGWNKDFSIITPEEELEMAHELIALHGLKIKYKNRLKKRLEQSARMVSDVGGQNRRPENDDFLKLQILINKVKRERNLMTFTDLILTALTLMDWNPSCVLVDEAQDCDEMQLIFLDTMIGENTDFFAVGDPNQTIYSWRGSRETTMFTLKRTYDAVEYSLPINYRSSAVILEASSRFMQSGTRLMSDKGLGEQIKVKNHYDPFQEAEYLAQRIQELHETNKYDYKDIAVFYRLQEQSELVEQVLERAGIPCHVAVKKTIADIPVLDYLIQLLRYACNPKDENALKRLVTNPSFGPSLKGKKARVYMEEKPYGVLPVVEQARSFRERFRGYEIVTVEELYEYFLMDQQLHPTSADYDSDKEYVYQFLERMTDSCNRSYKSVESSAYSALMQRGLEQLRNEDNKTEDTKGIKDIKDTKDIKDIKDTKIEIIDKIRDYLDQAALYNMQFFEENGDEVQLMTLHASKGLEFECVFIIGLNQGLIPLWGKNEAEEEEEGRLFFVGMTRAKERLELSYYTNPARQRVLGGPGRYLKMLPYHLLEWKEKRELAEKKAHLKSLRKSVMENLEREEPETIFTGDSLQEENFLDAFAKKDMAEYRSFDEEIEVKIKMDTVIEQTKKIRHPRYGVGTVIKEEEMTVTAEFEGYGEKSFLKMMVEYL